MMNIVFFSILTVIAVIDSPFQEVMKKQRFQAVIMVEEKTPPEDEAFVVILDKHGTLCDLEGHRIQDDQLELILLIAVGSPKGQCRVYLDVKRGTSTSVLGKALLRFRRHSNPGVITTIKIRM